MDRPDRAKDPIVFVNDQRTVLVRMWASGLVEVALRPDPSHIWGAPVAVAEERSS